MTNHTSLSGSLIRVLVWQLSEEKHLLTALCKVYILMEGGLWCGHVFFLQDLGLDSLFHRKELNAQAYQNILDNVMLQALGEQFGEGDCWFNMTAHQCSKQA